jgi:hypothetical protein
MMSDVFNLQEYDALCRSVLGTELPFPVTENFANAEFLIGGNRPLSDIQQLVGRPEMTIGWIEAAIY